MSTGDNKGIGIHRIVGGKIVEQWGTDDRLGLMQQLGILPPLSVDGTSDKKQHR